MSAASFDAVIVAGGSSRRMGFDKVLAVLAGKPVLAWSVAAFLSCPELGRLVVVCAAGRLDAARAACGGVAAAFVAGGVERADSVAAGLRALDAPDDRLVAVHDAARPLVSAGAIRSCLEAARVHGSAALAARLADSLHRCDAGGVATEAVPRDGLWCAQTPQIAPLGALRRAVTSAPATDEVAALASLGIRAKLVECPHPNFKITTPRDLELARRLLEAPQA